MDRRPEPELMLDDAQARAYAEADFAAPHGLCIDVLHARLPDLPAAGAALDLGAGPGDMTLRLARSLPGWSIDALDGSPAMLALARDAAARAGLAGRIRHVHAHLPAAPPRDRYDLLFAASLLHHLADPMGLWALARRHALRVFVMDLLRPESDVAARALVDRYAAGEPAVLRDDFHRSLCAAYRPDEIRAQLSRAGLDGLALAVVSDRHVAVWGRIA